MFDLTDYLGIFDTRSRPKFEINGENEKLLTAFKERNLIDNYEESSEKKGFYKIIRLKPAAKSLPKCRGFLNSKGCQAGTNLLYIDTLGDIYPCACTKSDHLRFKICSIKERKYFDTMLDVDF